PPSRRQDRRDRGGPQLDVHRGGDIEHRRAWGSPGNGPQHRGGGARAGGGGLEHLRLSVPRADDPRHVGAGLRSSAKRWSSLPFSPSVLGAVAEVNRAVHETAFVRGSSFTRPRCEDKSGSRSTASWRERLEEVVVYCPDRAKREFEDDDGRNRDTAE